MTGTEPNVGLLMSYIEMCIYHDFMMGILITSAAEGKLPSMGMDYGVGKSTLMLDIAYIFVDMYAKCSSPREVWNNVFGMLHSFPWEMEDFFLSNPERSFGEPVFYLCDDMQLAFGKDRSKDKHIRRLKNRMSLARDQVAVIIATAPDIGELAKPWRYFFNFEVKVPTRGAYEVQRLKKWTDFSRPYETQASLKYGGESPEFPILPPKVHTRYRSWRRERNIRADEGEGDWQLHKVRNVLTEAAQSLLKQIIEKGSLTRQHIITNLELGLELKLLQNCKMIEMFQDTAIPTRQARKLVNFL